LHGGECSLDKRYPVIQPTHENPYKKTTGKSKNPKPFPATPDYFPFKETARRQLSFDESYLYNSEFPLPRGAAGIFQIIVCSA
jgi:hypothetical protein